MSELMTHWLDAIGEKGREELLGCALKWAVILVGSVVIVLLTPVLP